MGAAAKKVDPTAQRRAMSVELVDLNVKHAKVFAREAELKTALKAIATDTANFQEVVVGKGIVKVAGKKDKKFLGNVPEIVPEAFNTLSKAEQNKLIKAGIVKIAENYSGAYYGAVTVDLF